MTREQIDILEKKVQSKLNGIKGIRVNQGFYLGFGTTDVVASNSHIHVSVDIELRLNEKRPRLTRYSLKGKTVEESTQMQLEYKNRKEAFLIKAFKSARVAIDSAKMRLTKANIKFKEFTDGPAYRICLNIVLN